MALRVHAASIVSSHQLYRGTAQRCRRLHVLDHRRAVPDAANRSGRARRAAIGETAILLHPPSPSSRCLNMDEEGVSAK